MEINYCAYCGFIWSSPSYLVNSGAFWYCPDHTPEALVAADRRNHPEHFGGNDNERKS